MNSGMRFFLCSVLVLTACSGGADDTSTSVADSSPIDSTSPDTASDTADDTGAADSTATETSTDTATDADAPREWPSCDSKPTGAAPSTIQQVWTADPASPVFHWISGSAVTAVSFAGCSAGRACQIFLQEELAPADLTAAARRAIKLFISAKAAERFTGIATGDRVDVAGYAVRYKLDGQNELLVMVNDLFRGCIKKTGTATVTPVAATLADLSTVAAYESTLGPVLVKLANLSGKPDTPPSIFGLYPTGGFDAGTDAGSSGIVSLSPYSLPSGMFTGLATGTKTDFASITGVFGMFYPGAGDAGPATKYLVVYPRQMSDVVKK